MAKKLSKAAAEALAATDWKAIDAMTDSDIARQIAANRDAVRRGCAARLRPRAPVYNSCLSPCGFAKRA